MDEQINRILGFLKNNDNCYFEATDIAYHLKLDELYIVKTLIYMQSQKMALAAMSPEGKEVWYAAPTLGQEHTVYTAENPIFSPSDPLSQNAGIEKLPVENVVSQKRTFPWFRIAFAVAVIILFSSGTYYGKCYVDKKFATAMEVGKASLPAIEYNRFMGKYNQDNIVLKRTIDDLYLQLETKNSQIDTLKLAIYSIQQQILGMPKPLRRKR